MAVLLYSPSHVGLDTCEGTTRWGPSHTRGLGSEPLLQRRVHKQLAAVGERIEDTEFLLPPVVYFAGLSSALDGTETLAQAKGREWAAWSGAVEEGGA